MTSLFIQALIISAVFVIFYLILVRPQQLRLKRHRELLAGLRPGLRVATVGGVVGTIVGADGTPFIILHVADGVDLTILRTSVDQVVAPAGSILATSAISAEQRAAA
jgi:preprotein translocase subunit YajC